MTATCSGSFRSPKASSPVRHVDHVDLGPAARRAGDEVDVLALAQPQRLEQLTSGAGLLDRISRQRVADRVADALEQQRGDAGRRFDEPGGRGSGLGDAEVQRHIGHLCELTVRLHHQGHVGRLDRDLHQVEVDLGEVGQLLAGRLDHRLGGESAVALVQCRVERAAVDADADRHVAVAGFGGNRLDVFGLADVARVEAQPLDAGLERRQRHAVLVVDIGDDRHRRAGHDLGEAFGRRAFVARAPHDVAAGCRKAVDLLQRALHVGRLRDGHRLHADGRVAADGDGADVDLAGATTFDHGYVSVGLAALSRAAL